MSSQPVSPPAIHAGRREATLSLLLRRDDEELFLPCPDSAQHGSGIARHGIVLLLFCVRMGPDVCHIGFFDVFGVGRRLDDRWLR